MTLKDFKQITQTWDQLEKRTVQPISCDPALSQLFVSGVQNPTVDTPTQEFLVQDRTFNTHFGYPINLLIREDGPCRQCPRFLRKLVLLSQTGNTNISGILEEFRNRGYSIHEIRSCRTCECLGLYQQRLLIDLIEHTEASDNIHDIQCALHKPCPYASECSRLYDQVVESARDTESYRARLLLVHSELEQVLSQLDSD